MRSLMGNGWQGARRQAASVASGVHQFKGIRYLIMRSLMGNGWQGARRRAASEASGVQRTPPALFIPCAPSG